MRAREVDDLLEIGRREFPLPTLGARLARIEHELIDGRGFVLIRGLPRERYDNDEMCLLVLGHRRAPRQAVAAEPQGPRARRRHRPGQAPDDPTRAATRSAADRFDVSTATARIWSACCACAAGRPAGCRPSCNAVTLHNHLVREQPELAAELYEPQPYDMRGEQKPGARGLVHVPVFTRWDDRAVRALDPPLHPRVADATPTRRA